MGGAIDGQKQFVMSMCRKIIVYPDLKDFPVTSIEGLVEQYQALLHCLRTGGVKEAEEEIITPVEVTLFGFDIKK